MSLRRGAHLSVKAGARVLGLEDMPAPRGLPLVGTTLSFLMAGSAPKLHEYVDARHKELGPVFRDTIGPVSAVFVSDPTEMRRTFGLEGKYPIHLLPEPWVLYNKLYGCKRGLFFMDGEEWLHTRRIMNKLMLKPEQLDMFLTPCQQVADTLVKRWQQNSSPEIKNLEKQLYCWSLDTIIASLLGSQYEAYAEQWQPDVEHLSDVVHRVFLESGRMSVISAKYARALHLPVWKRFVSSVDNSLVAAKKLVYQMIAACRSGPDDGLLPQMLKAGIAHDDIEKIVADLIIAAGDTTALSTQWALYLLAQDSTVQEEVISDIRNSSNPAQSSLLKGVVRETLRLHPVAPFLTRILPDTCVLGGYQLPPMQIIILSLYTSGRESKNFPQPNKFWPARWLRESESESVDEIPSSGTYNAVNNAHASLPFAMGARSCIGRKLAEAQMISTLAAVLSAFKMELMNNKVDMVLRLVAVPSEPIRIHLKPR